MRFFVLGVGLFLGCGPSATSPVANSEEKRLPIEECQRFLVLGPSTVETLFAVDLGHRIVGVSDYCHSPAAAGIPRVGGILNPNLERIIALKPDYFFVQGHHQSLQNLAHQQRVPYQETRADSLEDWFSFVRHLDEQFSQTSGEALIQVIQKELRLITQSAPKKSPSVLLVIGRQPNAAVGLTVSGPSTFLASLLTLAGGTLVPNTENMPDWYSLSEEALFQINPEIILECGPIPTQPSFTPLQLWQAAYPSLPAVKNNRVFSLSNPSITIPGPKVAQTAALIQECLLHKFAETVPKK